MAISKQKKQELIETYTELFKQSQGIIWLNNKGLSVSEIYELREKIYEANGQCKVTKNRLSSLALDKAGLPEMNEMLQGPTITGFAFGDTPSLAKVISEFIKDNDSVEIKGGLMGTEPMSVSQLNTLANLPPLPVLQSKLLGLLNAPAQNLTGVLSSSVRQIVNVVDGFSKSDQSN